MDEKRSAESVGLSNMRNLSPETGNYWAIYWPEAARARRFRQAPRAARCPAAVGFLANAAPAFSGGNDSVNRRSPLAQPMLPPHLDVGLLDDLPECPGVYVFNGEGGPPLHVAGPPI
ncbi:MAG: hypothetical protein ACREXY_12785 [Gammaproteobacteria bacterium]